MPGEVLEQAREAAKAALATVQQNKKMKISLLRIVPILTLFVLACGATQKEFEYLGEWSNVEVSSGEDPHASGYVLKLWKHKGKPVGFFTEFAGPPFDPPFGPLQDVTLDESAGALAFSAKLSPGIVFSREHLTGAPARVLYVFKGTLRDTEVKGTLESQDHLSKGAPVRIEVTLKRKSDPNADSHSTFQEWEEAYAPILRARGPKW